MTNHFMAFDSKMRLQHADDGILSTKGVAAKSMSKISAKSLLGPELCSWIQSLPIKKAAPGQTWQKPAQLKVGGVTKQGQLNVSGVKSADGGWHVLCQFNGDESNAAAAAGGESYVSSSSLPTQHYGATAHHHTSVGDGLPLWFEKWMNSLASAQKVEAPKPKSSSSHKSKKHHKKHESSSVSCSEEESSSKKKKHHKKKIPKCATPFSAQASNNNIVGTYQGNISFSAANSVFAPFTGPTTPSITPALPAFTANGVVQIPFAQVVTSFPITGQLQGGKFSGCLGSLSATQGPQNCFTPCNNLLTRKQQCKLDFDLAQLQAATLVTLTGSLNGSVLSGSLTGSLTISNFGTAAATAVFSGCYNGQIGGQFTGSVSLPLQCLSTPVKPCCVKPCCNKKKSKKSSCSSSSSSSSESCSDSD